MALIKPRSSLAVKLSFLISLPVLITSLALSSVFIRSDLKQIETAVIERGKSIASGLSRSSEYGLLIENKQILDELIDRYGGEKDVIYIYIQNVSGETLARHSELMEDIEIDTISYDSGDSSQELSAKCRVTQSELIYDFSCDVVTVRARGSREDIGLFEPDIKSPSRNIEKLGSVQVGLSKVGMISAMNKSMLDASWLTAIFIALAVVFTFFLVKIIVKPIKNLAVAAGEISQGNFEYFVETGSRDEIGFLAKSFSKMTADLKESSKALRYRLEIEKLVTSISTNFINLDPQEIDSGINYALHRIGRFTSVERSYVFLLSEDGKNIERGYGWCEEGLESNYQSIQGLPFSMFPWWIKTLKDFREVYVSDISELPDDAESAKEFLRSFGVRSLAVVPMVYGGVLIGILGLSLGRSQKVWIDEDITLLRMVGEIFSNALEHKRTQEALQRQLQVEEHMSKELEKRAEELSRTNEELNTFVYTVSHDLKSPLVSLQGFSSMLMRDHLDELGEDSRLYIERIQKNVENMGTFITDLLELSRVGRIKGREEEIEISDLISEVANKLAIQLEEKGTKLIIEENMPRIIFDRTRINQVFTNLIGNANKFMGEDNEVPTIQIGHEVQDGFHKFHVSDNGIGIDEKYHEKIFQIFQRLQDIETEGTGAGLAIVKKIVESMGGMIWVDSAKGKGTKMYFTIPEASSIGDDKTEVLDTVGGYTDGGG